jgi:glycosyltransferase involved in cell wall biosynthesis
MAANLRGSWLARLQVPFFMIAQTIALRRLLRRTGARVVNTHWMVPQGLSAAILRRIMPIKHVLHVHAADVYLLRRLPLGRAIARFVVERADWIFADGSHVKTSLDALIDRDSGAGLRPMGVWTRGFSTTDAPADLQYPDGYILFVGRLVEKKGVVYLLRALHLIRTEFPNLGLVLIGGGPLERVLRLEVDQLGLQDSVTFTGPMPHQEIVRYLHGCRVSCVPSIIDSKGETEGMPTVVIEAMAAGVPVVGSDVDGIPDVLRHRENGWLANPADAEDLARKLSEALTHVSKDSISKAARRTAELHDWERVAEQYAEAIAVVERE